eukprot:CAMPEP_0183484324 /NCGR_PEP_ID=MMETSP0370-20130417/178864_1 /TAXON_ID=268820 /ORGANISM="Peridinium aciculiferum, Strain PAER-2" /LENGTH=384 /DNA_ID=CAMNT_0025677615 /DNA_START=1 /DNA_END=1152 /DNA_ORIENTATION=-
MVMWLVKSEKILIQGLSKTNTGNFMGFAVGGPFMLNHTLVVYNSSLTGDTTGKLKVMLDGREILNHWDEKGNAEFEAPFLLWAARRTEWDVSMHDHDVLGIKPSINWAVGPWPKRFQQEPKGGLYYFKLPNEVEITVSGVDYMSAVIKMAPQQGQSGYCGNFNGIAEDEFEPPAPGSVPPVLVPAWNKAVGGGLEQVSDADNLFKLASPELVLSAALVQQASALGVGRQEDMAPQQGQSGYCGNFNGVAEDEFEPPAPGSVPPALVPAWNKAVGGGLEQVSDADNLFKLASPELALSAALVQQATALRVGRHEDEMMASPCKDAHALDEAEQACVSIPDADLRAACMADFCLTEKASVVDDAALSGVMADRLSDGRVPLFVGHG